MNDLTAKRELSEEAKTVLESKAFDHAVRELRKRWFDELMSAADTTERKLELLAQIKALETLPAQLKILVNDYTMAVKRQPGAAHG